jgi:hypothetical protein
LLELLDPLARPHPVPLFTQLPVGVDNAKRRKAKEVHHRRAAHPRLALLSLPPDCPAAHPIERAFGAGHDHCTRHHPRDRLWPLGGEVQPPLRGNGPWCYAPSELYSTPAVTEAVDALKTAETALGALSQLAA